MRTNVRRIVLTFSFLLVAMLSWLVGWYEGFYQTIVADAAAEGVYTAAVLEHLAKNETAQATRMLETSLRAKMVEHCLSRNEVLPITALTGFGRHPDLRPKLVNMARSYVGSLEASNRRLELEADLARCAP